MRGKVLTLFVAGIGLPLVAVVVLVGGAAMLGHPVDWTVPDATVLVGRFILGVLGGAAVGWLLASWFPDLTRRLLR